MQEIMAGISGEGLMALPTPDQALLQVSMGNPASLIKMARPVTEE